MHRSKASRVFAATLAMLALSVGSACKRAEPPAPPPPEVLVTNVVQKDVPIYSESVGTTVGFVNAQVHAPRAGLPASSRTTRTART